jgi:integral membrane sensor domain MASE1
MTHLLYWMGLTSPSSTPYLWWSGFGGCVRDFVALFFALKVHHWHRQRRENR